MAGCSSDDSSCYGEGEVLFGKEDYRSDCCKGLKQVWLSVVPRADYSRDDFPQGCGPAEGISDDKRICLPCGNGTCESEEQFCNCPEDCPRPDAGQ